MAIDATKDSDLCRSIKIAFLYKAQTLIHQLDELSAANGGPEEEEVDLATELTE